MTKLPALFFWQQFWRTEELKANLNNNIKIAMGSCDSYTYAMKDPLLIDFEDERDVFLWQLINIYIY